MGDCDGCGKIVLYVDIEGKPSFKLSEPVIVVYKDENLQAKVEKVLGHIVWLLKEAQKPEYDSQSGKESREIKKPRSSDENLQAKVEKVLGHIVWLLGGGTEAGYDSQSGK
ncbi:hypothetical protein RhiirC2_747804 [Rhizophagus irregularis]|uniref:Uncharacterized protein n=1 Tax=Rhizophagus irregularis TaxID=588596 RepID=A0A2N1N7B7_9GLOM|nr:hypothetical protein RhiirC2_747804 [Rhizophagus irregularis]